jgi:lysophospholipase L1-like esterase
MMPVGILPAGSGMRCDVQGNWIRHKVWGPGSSTGVFGWTGSRLEATDGRSKLVLSPGTGGFRFDALYIEVLMPDLAVNFDIKVDGVRALVDRCGGSGGCQMIRVGISNAMREITIQASGRGRVNLLGWGFSTAKPGVLLEANGFVGATVNVMERFSDAALSDGLMGRSVDLIILAFGTNEGANAFISEDGYYRTLSQHVGRLLKLSGNAAVLIVGAPDGYVRIGSGLREWRRLPSLIRVREAQRRVARDLGLAYWDFGVMTGIFGENNHGNLIQRMYQPDRVHLTSSAYELGAEKFFRDCFI